MNLGDLQKRKDAIVAALSKVPGGIDVATFGDIADALLNELVVDPTAIVRERLAALDTENDQLLTQLGRHETLAADLRGKIIGVQHSQRVLTEIILAAAPPQKEAPDAPPQPPPVS